MSRFSTDRFAPESYEDFLCRGKTAAECADIRARLAEQDRKSEEKEREEACGRGASADLSGCSEVSGGGVPQ